MLPSKPLEQLSPQEYELAVKAILDTAGQELPNYQSWHLRQLEGVDGEYVIDVLATFRALGANFVVLVECKHKRRPVEREDVQVLKDKLASTGAQKAMMFSLSGFQSGAITYGEAHGIALVQLAQGSSMWHTRANGAETPPPSCAALPEFVGWWQHSRSITALSPQTPKYIEEALGIKGAA